MNFLDSLGLNIKEPTVDDGPLGELANPILTLLQTNLWNAAFGGSGDGPETSSSTTSSSQTATENSHHPIPLMQWTQFRKHPLAGTSNFVEAHWLAIWRSTPRPILLLAEKGATIDEKELADLDKELFDTTKFARFDYRVTVLAYGDGAYGSIPLFKAGEPSRTSAPRGARTLGPIAAMERVPKAIPKKLDKNACSTSKIGLRIRKQNVKWLGCEETARPAYATLENDGQRIGGGYGSGLLKSLSLDPAAEGADGIITTIPQILTLWHVKASILYNTTTTDARIICDHHAIGYVTFAPGQVWRDTEPTIVVLQPAEGRWLKERLFWS
ncbi:hypothetical protein MFIFM68171_08170 [Madurella fahalii]|uniref:Uncharacterized protein n=1 Tax=Madurella fahalii TaxID=1157608 RepID=A0ABQ0GJL7_9PEZI